MRRIISCGHTPGVYYYNGKNGKILINNKNKGEIRKDAEELSKEIFNSHWICPQAMFKTSNGNRISKNSSSELEKVKNFYEKIIRSF